MKKLFAVWLTGIAVALGMPAVQAADPYPSKPVRMLTQVAPGAGVYLGIRWVAEALSAQLGQPVVVESSIGTGVASLAAARAQPDGHTLLYHFETLLTLKHLQPGVAYDPIADFAPIARLFYSPLVLAVNAKSGPRSMDELFARLRVAPGRLNYTSPGVGGVVHLATVGLLNTARLDATHIPFKSSGDATQALIRGDAEFTLNGFITIGPLVQSGQLRALGVTSAARLKQHPEVPTLQEVLKSESVILETWDGISAPARTPPAILRTVHAALVKILSDPQVQKAVEANGTAVSLSASPEEFADFMRRENERWRELVRVSGAKAN